MEAIRLVEPSLAYEEQIRSYRQEFLDRGDSLDGTSSLADYGDVSAWLAWLDKLAHPEICPDAFVPGTQLLGIRASDGKLVGMVNLRHSLNDHLRQTGGHIGYCVRPDERRKGCAKQLLRQALAVAAGLGLDRVLVTCSKDNEGSRRTILACGGVLENEVWNGPEGKITQRYWIDTAECR